MRWFGESWDAPVCEAAEHVETPVGRPCARCGEVFDATDRGIELPFSGDWPAGTEGAGVPFAGEPGSPHDPPTLAYHHMCFLAMVMPVVVHRLRWGFAVCGFTREPPVKWPHLHYWSDHEKQITCEGCKAS